MRLVRAKSLRIRRIKENIFEDISIGSKHNNCVRMGEDQQLKEAIFHENYKDFAFSVFNSNIIIS